MNQETNHMIDDDLTPYEQWQIDRYGNIITSNGELLTMEEEEQRRLQREAEFMENLYERRLDHHWNY